MVFFNEGPKLIHLYLRTGDLTQQLAADMLAVPGCHCQPVADGVQLDFRNTDGPPQPQSLGEQSQAQPYGHRFPLDGKRRAGGPDGKTARGSQ